MIESEPIRGETCQRFGIVGLSSSGISFLGTRPNMLLNQPLALLPTSAPVVKLRGGFKHDDERAAVDGTGRR